MDNLPNTWDEWITNFGEWQQRVGFNPDWLGDFELSVLFDWERAGDVIEFGDYAGRAKWERALQVPHQSMRDALITMITVQGDTEFASVEQQRHLLASAPTDYDRYAAARIMAEEQRHGWQMAYLLMTYFGQQGRREAQKLLESRPTAVNLKWAVEKVKCVMKKPKEVRAFESFQIAKN